MAPLMPQATSRLECQTWRRDGRIGPRKHAKAQEALSDMRIPVIRGVIERRILANYRVEPQALQGILPPPFRPKLVGDLGIAGICLIRLAGLRPKMLPRAFGILSENAAHRIAVEWDTPQGTASGVYIPRRDTSSALNALLGGRLFPGIHHRAAFIARESEDHLYVAVRSRDGTTHMEIEAYLAEGLPSSSIFPDLETASAFFEEGSLGYSPTSQPGCFDGLELRTDCWSTTPLEAGLVRSSFFEDHERFPPGAATFDHALLMRNIPHTWHGRDRLDQGRLRLLRQRPIPPRGSWS